MRIKIILILMSIMLVFISFILFRLIKYHFYVKDNFSCLNYCQSYDKKIYSIDEQTAPDNDCFMKMYSLILPKLLLYRAKLDGNKINYLQLSNEYVVPKEIMDKVHSIISYGLGKEMNFEYNVSMFYRKKTYIYDCGMDKPDRKNPYIFFGSECIVTDNYLMYNQKSSKKIHSFGEKLKELNLTNKLIYLKIGIPENAEVIEDILKCKKNIAGFSIVVDFWSSRYITDTMKMLDLINKDFILVSRNVLDSENNIYKIPNTKGVWTSHLSLTFINKSLVDEYSINFNQSNYENGYGKKYKENFDVYKYSSIDYIVVIYEKLKTLLKVRN